MANNNLGYSYYSQSGNGQAYQQGYGNQQGQNGYYQQNTPQQVQQYVSPIIVDFVQGELAAMIYPVAINQTVILFDIDDEKKMYKKFRDANGKISPLEKYCIVRDEDKPVANVNLEEYVKEDDVLEIISEAVKAEVERKFSEISFKPTTDNKFLKKGDKA